MTQQSAERQNTNSSDATQSSIPRYGCYGYVSEELSAFTFLPSGKGLERKRSPLSRETAANWYNTCTLEYLSQLYEKLHKELIHRSVIYADEVPCQVLHEEAN